VNKIFITLLVASCVVLSGSTAFAQTARARIAETPIRGEPNLASAIIATLHEGDSVDVVDTQGDWYRVLLPGNQSKPAVGYVLARLIEIVNTDGVSSRSPSVSTPVPPTSRPVPMVAQATDIPPTLDKLRPQPDKAAEREQALKAKVDALRTEVQGLQNSPAGSEPPNLRRPNVPGTAATARDKKVWIDVNLGAAQSAQGAQAFSFTTILFREPAAFASAYGKPSRGADFDFGGGYMFTPMFGVGLSVTGTADKNTAGLGATIPHPTIFDAASTGAGVTSTELERSEGALNIQVAVVPPLASDRVTVRLFAGPTHFRLKRQMVEDVRYTQQFGVFTTTNIISITGFDGREVEGTGWGFHGGADVGFFFSRYVGVGGTVRFSRGSVDLAEPLSEKQARMTTGGIQFGGGLRLHF
jgi:hypothetical protein